MTLPKSPNEISFSMLNEEFKLPSNSRLSLSDTKIEKLLGYEFYDGTQLKLSKFYEKSLEIREPPTGGIYDSRHFIQLMMHAGSNLNWSYDIRWNNSSILYEWNITEEEAESRHMEKFYEKDGWRYYKGELAEYGSYRWFDFWIYEIYRIKV